MLRAASAATLLVICGPVVAGLANQVDTTQNPATTLSDSRSWTFYDYSLPPLLLITLVMLWITHPRAGADTAVPSGFGKFKLVYLSVWYVAVAADWLQGPYVYDLYASYGYKPQEIAQLFVAGFSSSMLFGMVVGSVADAFGRKRSAVLYCFTYFLACLSKHWSNYWVLMMGRIFGGIATSLLFSVFESWLVYEHIQRRGYSESLLHYMFSMMYSGMYAVAILTGLLAQFMAGRFPLQDLSGAKVSGKEPVANGFYWGGDTAPFDTAAFFLVLCAVGIVFLWEENYGRTEGQSLSNSISRTMLVFREKKTAWPLMIAVSCFEGAMFCFVFNWTPALDSQVVPPPHGQIFSLFMMACACGASTYGLTHPHVKESTTLMVACAGAMGALLLATRNVSSSPDAESSTAHLQITFYAFLAFEFCIGLYFPAMGTVKSEEVPEPARAGVYNFFRVPLNGVVVGLLLNKLSLVASFGTCCCLISLALAMIALLGYWKASADAEQLDATMVPLSTLGKKAQIDPEQ